MKHFLPFLFIFFTGYISAQRAYLLKDINTESSFGADVENLIEFNGKLIFSAENEEYGDELWETDGTPEGTKLLVDIDAGSSGSTPRYLTILDNKLYFRADDNATGQELWVTDGTPEGTQRITDINPGPNDSQINDITVFNGKLYFEADDGIHGRELWVSDGTTAGTQMVKDINVGDMYTSSSPGNFTEYNGKLYFAASQGTLGTELWVTDGTEAGTQLVKDIDPTMYYSGGPRDLVVYNGKLYFAASGGNYNTELWESDGTEAGTQLAVEINPTGNSDLSDITVFNNKLYFQANNGLVGRELFESDGTPAGTILVKDFNPTGNSFFDEFTLYQGNLYFSAYTNAEGSELWVTDGTEAGTQLVKDIFTGIYGSSIRHMTVFDNKLFFGASDENNENQLWTSDGTEAGTQQFFNISQGSSASNAKDFIDYNNEVYFRARDNIYGNELWKSDGTEAGTIRVKDIWPGSSGGADTMLGVLNGKLYFEANNGVAGRELWETDGTEAGTKLVKDINPGSSGSSPDDGAVLNNKLYFEANDGIHGSELWVTDGTDAGTQLVKDINPGATGGGIQDMIAFNNKIYFSANDGIHGYELWVTDGTEAGTGLVKDIAAAGIHSSPRYFAVHDNKVYFQANDAIHGGELWVSDGTEAGTQMVKDINPSTSWSSPQWLVSYNGKLYFKANDGIHGDELWESDGTEAGTKLAVDIREGNGGSSVRELVVLQGKIYFRANDDIWGSELWVTDGTAEGTRLAADMRPGPSGSSLDDMVVSNGRLFFNADDGIYGEEAWAYEPFDCNVITSNIIYVTPTGEATNYGNSWAEATSFQHALQLATECSSIEEIWVQQGSYKAGNNRYDTFYIPDNLKIYGGFNGTETNLSERDWVSNPTIFSGDIGIPNSSLGNSNTLLHLLNTDNVLIDGFIIEDGYAEYDSNSNFLQDTNGGGIFLKNANNNSFVNCIIRNNLAQNGGAIYQISGTNNQFVNCLFYGNEGLTTNVVYAAEGTMSFVNCSIANNSPADASHGIFGNDSGNITLENTVVAGNHTLNHNTTNTGTLTATYSYLKGENPSGTGNIDGTTITDVLFKDVANEDFTLQGSSPLVDAGNNTATFQTKDLRGADRIIDGDLDTTNTIDIGAYEFGKSEQIITFGALADVTYGDADFNLSATTDSGLAISYTSSDTSVATISGNTVTIVGAGTTTITASQAGDPDFKPAIDVSQTLTVLPRSITVTADAGQNKVFNTADPTFTYVITTGSLVSGDVLNGTLVRTTGEDVGLYPINQGTLDNTNYDITFVGDDFEITKADQIITFASLADVTYGDADFNLTASSDAGLAISYTSSDTSVATVSGNTVTIVGVGTTTITASQAGNNNYNAAVDASQTLTVNPRAITVTADAGQSKIFGATEPVLTYTITTGSLVSGDVLNGVLARTTGEDVGLYPINQGTLDNTNYNITFVGDDFEITKADQIITFASLADVTYGDADFNLTASSDAGLAISYTSSNTSVATVSGNTVTIVGVGNTTIIASQAGNDNYNAAIDVSQTLTVNPRAITVTADSGQSKVFGSAEPVLTYAITSGSLVSGDVLNGALARTAGEDVGLYPINQGTLDNTNYNITFVGDDFEITKADQVITFNSLADVTYGDADFNLTASSDAGLAISYTSSNTSVATVSGNTITIVGVGSTTITASQAGNNNYNAAVDVSQTLTVNPRAITVTADPGQSKIFGATEPVLTYTITSGSLVSGDILNGTLARTAGEDVGLYPINQGTLDNANYDITFVGDDFEITKADQVITFASLADVTYGDVDFNLNASSDAGLAISYTSSNTSVATVSGNTVTIVGVGSTTITASQAGNNNYNAAIDVSQTLTVNPRAITVTADSGQSKVFGSAEPVLTYTITSSSLISGDILNGTLARTAGEDVGFYPINLGTLGNSNYDITFISNDFEITGVNQVITFNNLADATYGDADFNLTASSDAGLAISYTSSNTSVATVSGNTVTIVGVGSTTITASQAGNNNYNAAVDVSQMLTVNPRAITVTADANQSKTFGATEPVLTYTITSSSLISGDILNGTLARTAGEDVGSYPINQGTLNHPNYQINFITNSFEINKADQFITFDELSNVKLGNPAFELNAIASSGLAITYSSSDPSIVSISGNMATIHKKGSVIISAYQDGNENYHAATFIDRSLTVLSGQIQDELIKLYPNPVIDHIRISETPSNNRLSIYDVNGQLVKRIFDYTKDEIIDVTGLQSGIYMVEILYFDYRGKTIVRKFLKE
ncbi:ELWxxDGT repeat protein [Aquimarina litoralis]|uniref:ELWxxDGT repeat protein n=1 Tax=Aquimarina litoralis TaxID=584605 RepID=UPI001C584099|nr:ELWxxDGT repeat protein [Aquimarina litoralis]MBW1296391.1 T9SS type A sorting domain-containing protein [Aquimarina litoralis]